MAGSADRLEMIPDMEDEQPIDEGLPEHDISSKCALFENDISSKCALFENDISSKCALS